MEPIKLSDGLPSRINLDSLPDMDKETPEARLARKFAENTKVPKEFKACAREAFRGPGLEGEVAGKHGSSLS